MSLTMIKVCLLVACFGHILCLFCDRAITYTKNGRFDFAYLNDNDKLSNLFANSSLKKQLFSMLAGVVALTMTSFGYIAIYQYVNQYSSSYALILLIAFCIFIVSGTAHHVFCGVIEWFYIRLGRTEEMRITILEFFKKTIWTMYACFIGVLIFAVTFFIAIISNSIGLPWYVCFINPIIIFFLIVPFRIVGSFNLVSALTFLGLFIVLCLV